MGAQRCRDDGSGYGACLGCESADLAGADLLMSLDLSVSLDMSGPSPDLPFVVPDLAVPRDMAQRDFSSPGPKDLAGVDFGGIACGVATCDVGDACCSTPANGGPSRACVDGTTCPGSAWSLACDGAEDCGGAASICCITVTQGGGGQQSTGGAKCTASCAAQLTSGVGMAGNGSLTTKLCHGAADCTGYAGTTPFGAAAFDRCCVSASSGVHFCAPGIIAFTTPQTTCD